jgi:hypothetical protein
MHVAFIPQPSFEPIPAALNLQSILLREIALLEFGIDFHERRAHPTIKGLGFGAHSHLDS